MRKRISLSRVNLILRIALSKGILVSVFFGLQKRSDPNVASLEINEKEYRNIWHYKFFEQGQSYRPLGFHRYRCEVYLVSIQLR